MPTARTYRDIATGCALWLALAIASLALRNGLDAMLLMWAPAGVLMATLLVVRRRYWAFLAAAFLPVQALSVIAVGVPVGTAFAYSGAALLQGLVCALLSVRVLGSRDTPPRNFRQVAGLIAAVFIGCLVGTLASMPFRPAPGWLDFTTWLLGNMLGIFIVAPALMRLRTAWQYRARAGGIDFDPSYALSLLGCAALAAAEMRFGYGLSIPLLVAAMVGMTLRYGQSAVGLTLLTYFAVVTAYGVGGRVPHYLDHLPAMEAMLVLQVGMLSMFATALPITAMMLNRDQLQVELIRRNTKLHDNLMLLDLGEELAGIGRWRVNLVTGEQEWSPRMLELNGLPADLGPDPGDIRNLLPDGGTKLFDELTRNRHEREPYSFNYTIKPPDRTERILRVSILNEYDVAGRRLALFGVAMDVTEQVRREQALELARGRAVRLAAEAQVLANTDPLTNLPNRRCTFDRLASMVKITGKQGAPLSAIMFDIDHFKAINDTHGHQTGDEVIVMVAELARRQARQGDTVGRIGGEEYVWLLPGVDAVAARKLAERLRVSVESGIEGSALPNVTISIGLAEFRTGDDGDRLLARADAALYEAKESGRNRVRRAA